MGGHCGSAPPRCSRCRTTRRRELSTSAPFAPTPPTTRRRATSGARSFSSGAPKKVSAGFSARVAGRGRPAVRRRRKMKEPRRLTWLDLVRCGAGRSGAQAPHVLRGRSLLPLDDVELHRFAFGKRLVALTLDCGMMDEAILLAVGAADEAESLRLVEPLDGAGRSHVLNSCPVVMHLAGARVRTRCHANRR